MQSSSIVQHNAPIHTFMEKKPPLLPRQSTGDILSFTQIIADRLEPGQTVWDYFSPAPPPPPELLLQQQQQQQPQQPQQPLSPVSPTATSPTFGFFGGNKRQSMIFDNATAASLDLSAPPAGGAATTAGSTTESEPAARSSTSSATAVTGAVAAEPAMTKIQKRRSFVQSFRHSMLSLSQLLTPATKPVPKKPQGPPHYNILVLGSDSAPLASTLYKMSSVLPNSTKIGHYQEVSGFFVAYFGSNGSYSSSPKTSTEVMTNGADRDGSSTRIPEGQDEVKSRRGLETIDGQDYSGTETTTATDSDDKETKPESEGNSTDSLSSNYASLSVHAFSLDTTWPVPRMLAQQFWFPHAHGIIYIVDATRKNEPRGMDHLLNARQFLASLVVDQTLGGPNNNGRKARSSIPLVVFANKAGMDEETCFRVDEIAEILGCEEWDDLSATNGGSGQSQEGRSSSDSASSAGNSLATSRPWCVKSTRSDGAGEGLRESVEWLKSRMGEVWRS